MIYAHVLNRGPAAADDGVGGPGEYTRRDTLGDVAAYLDPRRSLCAAASGWLERPGSR